jgi:hypothetical protein
MFKKIAAGFIAGLMLTGPVAADTIDPATYTDTLAIGESVTIRKTVTIDDAPPTDSVLDVMFIFDNTGSMGGEIAAAKAKAGDILTSLAGFGNLATGTGWYNDPSSDGVLSDLTTNPVAGVADINAVPFFPGSGGDADERGYAGVKEAADDASWRPGSNRFVIAFGDAGFKTGPASDDNQAGTIASLNDKDATFIGVAFTGGGSDFNASADPLAAATGGSVFAATATGDSIAAAILLGIAASFEDYTDVTVSDLGSGLPGVGVGVVCVSADTGVCAGDTATGVYDRSIVRTFGFDVTFTGLEAGEHHFSTHALVDGGIVASEEDWITVGRPSSVPEPGTLGLLAVSLLGIGATIRRRAT